MYKNTPNTPKDLTVTITAFLVKILMGNYDISIPKWIVWIAPLAFATGFAIFFNGLSYLFHPLTCASFHTQKDAQVLFDTNRQKYSYLDINHDAIACNGL